MQPVAGGKDFNGAAVGHRQASVGGCCEPGKSFVVVDRRAMVDRRQEASTASAGFLATAAYPQGAVGQREQRALVFASVGLVTDAGKPPGGLVVSGAIVRWRVVVGHCAMGPGLVESGIPDPNVIDIILSSIKRVRSGIQVPLRADCAPVVAGREDFVADDVRARCV